MHPEIFAMPEAREQVSITLAELNAWRERWQPIFPGGCPCEHDWIEHVQDVGGEPYTTRACARCGQMEERAR